MRLINKKSGEPIVEFQGDKAVFYSKFLEHEMLSMGIPIPHGMRSLFNGQDCVKLGDTHFQQAFKEVYYLTVMGKEEFEWRA